MDDHLDLAGETNSWQFRADSPIRVHSRLAVNTAESAIEGALAGIGLTRVLSYQVADAVQAGKLVVVLRKFEPEPSPISQVYVQERRLTAKLRAFLDFATPKLREQLA
jgi:DNA-binding transcriptional LysR family regulator